MVRKVTATEAKAGLLRLLDEVSEGETVEITRHGRLVARLVGAAGPRGLRGSVTGIARTADGAADDDLFSTGVRWDAES